MCARMPTATPLTAAAPPPPKLTGPDKHVPPPPPLAPPPLPSAYATGLLLARRVLQKFKLDEVYEGNTEAPGKDYQVEAAPDAPKPFRCYLDVGLARTSTGAKVFGALKGALDGGLDVPHSDKRFAGYDKDDKKLDTETHAQYIMGGIIGEYAAELQEEEPEKYARQFKARIPTRMFSLVWIGEVDHWVAWSPLFCTLCRSLRRR